MKFSTNRPKVFFKTFGCRTNIFDTQVMISNLKDFDVTQDESEANIVVINSCTVTNSADTTARSYINGLKKLSNNPKVVFTGCGTRTKGEKLFSENKIDALFGASLKENINELLKKDDRFFEEGDLKSLDKTIVEEFVGKSRAFIKIQEGCDFRCSYCIIPFVRGDARSYEENVILNQVETLAQNGFSEFILTGTNVGSYGKKMHTSLAKLLKKMALIKGVKRIRMGSIEPIQIDDEFKELINEPFMAKHLHIALQHTSKEMLKIMNRRNKVLSDLELFEFLSQNGYALGTDFIVGHPGETQEIWSEAMKNLHNFPLTHVHAFTYSKRDGTPSASMKDMIKGDIAKARYIELVEIIKKKNYEFRKNSKSKLEVLVEQEKNGKYLGFDQFFNQVEISSSEDLVGDWLYLDDYLVKDNKNEARFK
ncbi:tRNA (N(6)-L-threonylcarbamoyladenosine(37)-C(2))-methylthiotransferase MtaB [Aliarcobacter skirrowii]|uniref:MiaB/RimO family radical SAM methylthiotransferase n=1 Tax=Aliarcobacter skirrowii CCUG 10374 TaxID=1032239 RepID=A0AAD0SMT6_9BACT|nr:tRNA (N(6)-L-threonylcarbamoyladenosine(37)-C(2))-methylthiotransferase MtaB [Aliarcobacter skirrowii]AXX85008.1 MiaB/RimO family radical SAM methylthiotransferase [Aliarcobacter skirrowii CCUG 10374]KAB0620830.1 tRNA (N(6)-L-threonylcarbamoyladenosine(37)-C(2))-methylthiotransferase MtaB [Aliarcobacter skirrowii CCUG 10374]RXI25826.1 tRNA (N(6)-L-threonylcarbamoyladenosine(37)-C(2))-methylthiotransferase MtaB [Aliarcobacter skirrowii CCUG 10374]SUU96469.1 (Dimethylallyl)adenosine tRNA methy